MKAYMLGLQKPHKGLKIFPYFRISK